MLLLTPRRFLAANVGCNCMRGHLTIVFLLLGFVGKAQFPFEVFPKISYNKYEIIHTSLETDSSFIGISNITDNQKSKIRIELKEKSEKDSSNIFIFRKDKLVQKIIEPFEFYPVIVPDSLYAGDINNDGLLDIKIVCYNAGCGLAASLTRKIFLIGKPDGKFDKFSFMDFSYETERDFNGDKIYEIIGVDHVGFQNHSYWVYDLFNLKNGQFINVSNAFDYPIMIQHLYRENFSITNKISRTKMKEFSRLKPDWYDERKY